MGRPFWLPDSGAEGDFKWQSAVTPPGMWLHGYNAGWLQLLERKISPRGSRRTRPALHPFWKLLSGDSFSRTALKGPRGRAGGPADVSAATSVQPSFLSRCRVLAPIASHLSANMRSRPPTRRHLPGATLRPGHFALLCLQPLIESVHHSDGQPCYTPVLLDRYIIYTYNPLFIYSITKPMSPNRSALRIRCFIELPIYM